jgi:hypothetical protein
MAGGNGSKPKRGRPPRQAQGRRSLKKTCRSCGQVTTWLSVDRNCWDCTVKAVKNKAPIYIEAQEEESESSDVGTSLSGE